MVSVERRDRVVQACAARLARELGRTPEQISSELNEAIAAGLLRVTRSGLRAVIPPDEDKR